MKALKDLFASEKGLVALLLLAVVSAALFTGHTDFEGWQRFAMIIYGTYAVTKAGTSVAAIIKGNGEEAEPPKEVTQLLGFLEAYLKSTTPSTAPSPSTPPIRAVPPEPPMPPAAA